MPTDQTLSLPWLMSLEIPQKHRCLAKTEHSSSEKTSVLSPSSPQIPEFQGLTQVSCLRVGNYRLELVTEAGSIAKLHTKTSLALRDTLVTTWASTGPLLDIRQTKRLMNNITRGISALAATVHVLKSLRIPFPSFLLRRGRRCSLLVANPSSARHASCTQARQTCLRA